MNYGFLLFKVLAIYVVLIVILRILGKREVGQLSIFDLVVLLILADIASIGIDNSDFFIPSLFCLALIVFFQKIIASFLLHHAKYRSLMDGSPVILVENGHLLVQNMKKEHYTIDDLLSQMRTEHVLDINEIRLAVLETNGTLSIFRNSRFDTIRLPVICSGLILKENLPLLHLNEADIHKILSDYHLELKKVLYASYGEKLFYYFYRNDHKEAVLVGQSIELSPKSKSSDDKTD